MDICFVFKSLTLTIDFVLVKWSPGLVRTEETATLAVNIYFFSTRQDLTAVQRYEQDVGGIVLDPSHARESSMYFSTKYPHTMLPRYADMYDKKAGLIIRMLEIRVGQELLLQVTPSSANIRA